MKYIVYSGNTGCVTTNKTTVLSYYDSIGCFILPVAFCWPEVTRNCNTCVVQVTVTHLIDRRLCCMLVIAVGPQR